MEFRIWVETRLDDRILERELVSRVERPACGIEPEEIGLSLEEGKAVLRKCSHGLFKPRWMCWVQLTGDAAIVAATSASRICATERSERSLGRSRFLAVAIFVASAKAESE